jgi:hypothetical protein
MQRSIQSRVTDLEVLVENCGNPRGQQVNTGEAMTACSACAGDYEDPDRSAWSADEMNDVDDTDSNSEVSGEREEVDEAQS